MRLENEVGLPDLALSVDLERSISGAKGRNGRPQFDALCRVAALVSRPGLLRNSPKTHVSPTFPQCVGIRIGFPFSVSHTSTPAVATRRMRSPPTSGYQAVRDYRAVAAATAGGLSVFVTNKTASIFTRTLILPPASLDGFVGQHSYRAGANFHF
jgi:hypothetical protein